MELCCTLLMMAQTLVWGFAGVSEALNHWPHLLIIHDWPHDSLIIHEMCFECTLIGFLNFELVNYISVFEL